MALFTGSGVVTLAGSESRMYDMEIRTSSGFVSTGGGARIENCLFDGDGGVDIQGPRTKMAFCRVAGFSNVGINVDDNDCLVEGCQVDMTQVDQAAAKGILINTGQRNRVIGNSVTSSTTGEACIEADGDYQAVIGNTVRPSGGVIGILNAGGNGEIVGNTVLHSSAVGTGSGGAGIRLGGFALGVTVANNYIVDSYVGIASLGSTGQSCLIADNFIYNVDTHGIHLNAVSRHTVQGNHILDPGDLTSNTYDGIILEANCDECTVIGNVIDQSGNTPRYGINIANANCDNNVYVGNRAVGTFGTAAYNDAGTGSVNTWPAAGGAQGDNLL